MPSKITRKHDLANDKNNNNYNKNNIVVRRMRRYHASYIFLETRILPIPRRARHKYQKRVLIFVCVVHCRVENSLYYIIHTGDVISSAMSITSYNKYLLNVFIRGFFFHFSKIHSAKLQDK